MAYVQQEEAQRLIALLFGTIATKLSALTDPMTHKCDVQLESVTHDTTHRDSCSCSAGRQTTLPCAGSPGAPASFPRSSSAAVLALFLYLCAGMRVALPSPGM